MIFISSDGSCTLSNNFYEYAFDGSGGLWFSFLYYGFVLGVGKANQLVFIESVRSSAFSIRLVRVTTYNLI